MSAIASAPGLFFTTLSWLFFTTALLGSNAVSNVSSQQLFFSKLSELVLYVMLSV